MNEKNIETIKSQLFSLGLPPEIEFNLRANMCLQQDQFQVSHRILKEQDIMNTIFYFERREGGYSYSYYEAWLRKKIFAPELKINEIDLVELDERMTKIDWQNVRQYEAIENIIVDLKKLSVTPDGVQHADRLKVKFWMDTALVSLISNPTVLKNQYEISQRFYFFQDEEQISLDEAYRFLCHRWREKQLNAKKRQTESDSPETSVGGATKDNRLLIKKRNNNSKKHK